MTTPARSRSRASAPVLNRGQLRRVPATVLAREITERLAARRLSHQEQIATLAPHHAVLFEPFADPLDRWIQVFRGLGDFLSQLEAADTALASLLALDAHADPVCPVLPVSGTPPRESAVPEASEAPPEPSPDRVSDSLAEASAGAAAPVSDPASPDSGPVASAASSGSASAPTGGGVAELAPETSAGDARPLPEREDPPARETDVPDSWVPEQDGSVPAGEPGAPVPPPDATASNEPIPASSGAPGTAQPGLSAAPAAEPEIPAGPPGAESSASPAPPADPPAGAPRPGARTGTRGRRTVVPRIAPVAAPSES